jgi:hypothetical protein
VKNEVKPILYAEYRLIHPWNNKSWLFIRLKIWTLIIVFTFDGEDVAGLDPTETIRSFSHYWTMR